MIDMLIGTVLALAGPPQRLETMSVRPMSETEAVSEFESVCVQGLDDGAAMADAAAQSARRYAEEAASQNAAAKVRRWSSSYGTLQYIDSAGGRDGRPFRECTFTAYTPDRVNRRMVSNALETIAGRRAASALTAVEDGLTRGWVWRDGAGHRLALYSVAVSHAPHQITLSIQSKDQPE